MNSKKTHTELRKAIGDLKPQLKQAAWFSVFASLLILAPSVYMLEVYDRVINSRSHMTLSMLTILVVATFVVIEVLDWVRSEVMHEAAMIFDKRMSHRVFSAIFKANLKRLPGGTDQPMNDFRAVRDFLFSPVLLALMESPVSLVFLALIFIISPVLGWAAVVGAMLQTFVGWLNGRSTQAPLLAANRGAIAAQKYADGTLRNAQVIESMGMLRDIHRRWMEKQREFLSMQAQASEKSGFYQAISKLLQNVVSSLLLGLGAWLLLRNQLNGGAAYMIVGSILGGRVLAPLINIISQWQKVISVQEAYQRLDSLLIMVPEHQSGMPLPAPIGQLLVESLFAGAPGSPVPILKGVNFGLQPGEVLAVVGPSASGKTTLARMLVGLWPASSGKVRLDGVDIHTWNKNELGPHVGYLPQGVDLFDGTVAENIARFGTVDSAKVAAAARAVGLNEFILSLPHGYDNTIGLSGATLSGGQRQRVGLARAIYANPTFLVLDEPNSSLDEEGDAALSSVIVQMKSRGTTIVVMTHRTSVLGVADKMLVLKDGQTHMFGPRDDVLKAVSSAAAKARTPASQKPMHAGA